MPAIELQVLRRGYTRTLNQADVRSIAILAASLDDVHSQWKTFCDTSRSSSQSPETASSADPIALMGRTGKQFLDKLVSQVKAIKQELLVHLNSHVSDVRPEASSIDTVWCVHHATNTQAQQHNTTTAVRSSAYIEVLLTARRAWMWSLFMGIFLSDMELLSGTIAFGAGLFFSIPTKCVTCGVIIKTIQMVQNEFNGKGALQEERVVEYQIAADCVRRSVVEEVMMTTCCGDDGMGSAMDALFAHSCALLYNIVISEDVAATHLHNKFIDMVESDMCCDCSKQCETSESPAAGNADALILRAIAAGVVQLAELLASQDYVTVQHVLVLRCAHPKHGSFFHGIRFLLRSLYEHAVRRQCLQLNLGNAFRPIPVVELPAGASVETALNTIYNCSDSGSASTTRFPLAMTEAVQRESLRLHGGPWPAPVGLIRSAFSLC